MQSRSRLGFRSRRGSSKRNWRPEFPDIPFPPKGTVSRDFRPVFWVKKLPVLHMNRQKRFRELFRLRKDIRERCVYVCVCVSAGAHIFNYSLNLLAFSCGAHVAVESFKQVFK